MESDEDIVAEAIDAEYDTVTALDGESSEIVSKSHPGSFVMYQVLYDQDIMDIQHVYVPKEFRHHGVAEGLVRKALSVAIENGWKVRPTCSYVRDTFFGRYPELKEQHVA